MGIFTKDCPVCAASHPIHAVRCGCGYCFDPHKLDGVTQELEVIAQEERLYRDYLSARAAQADDAWKAAKVASAIDPSNTVKAAEALLAEQTALNARAELEAQDARAEAVGARIKVVRSNRRNRRQAKGSSSTKSSAPPSIRAALAPPTAKKALNTPARPAPVDPQNHAKARPAPTPVPAKQAAPAPQPVSKPAPVAKPAQPQVKPIPIPTPTLSRARPVPAITQKPTPAFRTTQASKAEQVVSSSQPNPQECPNCSARVAPEAKRCRCGYELPQSASQIPSLSMSAEDQAAFLAALTPAKPKS